MNYPENAEWNDRAEFGNREVRISCRSIAKAQTASQVLHYIPLSHTLMLLLSTLIIWHIWKMKANNKKKNKTNKQ